MTSNALVNAHWRARLAEVQDLLIVGHSADDIAKAVLQLTAVLHDEWDARPALPIEVHNEIVVLRSLVRDASRILERLMHQPDLGWGSDVTDWQRSAEPFVKG